MARVQQSSLDDICHQGNQYQPYTIGDFDAAITASEGAYRISGNIQNLWCISFHDMEGELVYKDRGELARAIEMMGKSIRLGDLGGFSVPRFYVPP